MKTEQISNEFNPISIILETKNEAKALFGLIDKVENFRCNQGQQLKLTDHEISLVVKLSNINTNREVKF